MEGTRYRSIRDSDASSKRHVASWVCLTFAAALLGIASAATFDPTVSAPPELTGVELRNRVPGYFRDGPNSKLSAALRDRNAHAQWVDFRWQFMEAIDAATPLKELEEFGLISNGDGSYSIDLIRFPHWYPLDARMKMLRNPGGLAFHVEELRIRGFRDQDISALREYLAKMDPERGRNADAISRADSFVARIKARKDAPGGIERAELRALLYQQHRSAAEASRAWAVGLLDCLDPQRQRILESYLLEWHTTTTIAASKPADREANLEELERQLLSGEYVKPAVLSEEETR